MGVIRNIRSCIIRAEEIWGFSWRPPTREQLRAFREGLDLNEEEMAIREQRIGKVGKNGPPYPTIEEMNVRLQAPTRWKKWEGAGMGETSCWVPLVNELIAGEIDFEDMSPDDEPFETVQKLERKLGWHASEFMGCTHTCIDTWKRRGVLPGSHGGAALARLLAASVL